MPRSAPWILISIGLIVTATFGIDLATPRGVAAGVFPYFLAIFLAAWLPWPLAPYAVAAVASLFSVLGYLLTSGGNPEIILLNRFLIFTALWLSAGLAQLRIRADQSLREDRGLFQARVESILDQNLGHLRHAQRLARLSYWIWDPGKQRVTETTLGTDLDDSLPEVEANLPDWEFVARYVHPEDRERVLAAYGVDADEIGVVDIEYRLVLPGGEERHVHEIGEPVIGPGGKPIAQFGTLQDITQQKQTQQALRDSEARFRDFAEIASDYFWETGPDLRFTYVSERRQALTGLADEDYLGKTPWELAPAEAGSTKWREERAEMEARRPIRGFTYSLESAEGRTLHIRISGKPIFDSGGAFLGYRGTASDITAQVEAETALRDSEGRFRDFAETASDYLWEMGPDLRFTFTQAQRSSLGIDPARLLGKTRWELAGVDPEQDPKWRGHYAQLEAREPFRNFVFSFDDPSGEVHIRVNGNPVFDAQGEFAGYRGTASDISAEIEAEAALRSSEASIGELQARLVEVSRSSAMGQLSSTIAHELHQPLTAILNTARAGQRSLEARNTNSRVKLAEMIGLIGQQAERAGEVIRSLRRFFERRDIGFEAERLVEVVEEACELGLIGARERGIEVELDFGAELPPVPMDKVQIEQVIFNLLRNAVEALGEAETHRLTVRVAAVGDTDVQVSVCDTGPGLPPEIRDRLFEPFVTTKPGGIGIGLSTSHTIIETHGGRLWETANAPGGTCFHFTLPVIQAGHDKAGGDAETPSSAATTR